jgi:aryl-alcohol dehydrogenase-like predicted oxidoreductase
LFSLELPRRPIGDSGISVSLLSLGTVSLGLDYGIEAPGGFGCPNRTDAERLILAAADAGINLFDTAPAYGASESVLGEALAGRRGCLIATKVAAPPASTGTAGRLIEDSLERSLANLRRDAIDIVQIHNATLPVLARGEIVEALLMARRRGKIRLLGASVYTEEEALAVIAYGCFDVLQVAYNLLDQQMAERVFAAAAAAGVAVILRSALLKGALTEKAQWLPPELSDLRKASESLKDRVGSWEELTRMAYRFCISVPQASSVLAGARTLAELNQAITAARAGVLSPDVFASYRRRDRKERWLNPSYWNVP